MADNIDSVVNQINAIRAQSGSTLEKENRADFFRVPFIMDCVSWRPAKKIVFRCNPEDVSMTFPQRGVTQNVKVGKVFYWWRNPVKRSHFDLPTFNFTFQSGNIVMMKGSSEVYVPEGLDNFYQFMSLLDEIKMMPDGTPNFITIQHHSAIFPSLTLVGFFDPSREISIKETAGDSSMKWEGSFLVHDSTPAFNSASFSSTFSSVFRSSMQKLK